LRRTKNRGAGHGDRPEFVLEPHSESSLAKDQQSGIDEQRYHETLVMAGAM